uniref:HMG box domain-containing protein n=1 Tax=viral metagenome TaxID=1070528 RepID=A0A6C0L9H3_9ZZZZ
MSSSAGSTASATAVAVAVMPYNPLIKEVMAKMPDTFNTKKEIDEYYKKAMKEINDKLKEEKKANNITGKAPRKALGVKPAPKKRAKKAKEVDEDGNEIVKVKKPLNNYQKFIQEQRPKVKEDYPEMSGEEIFTKIAELWKIHKENMKSDEDTKKSDSEDDKKSDSEDDDKKSDSDDITVVKEKKEDKKKEKKEKPEKKDKKEVAK